MKKKFAYILFLLITTLVAKSQSDSIIIISRINISGNKITKEKIILKELKFQIGDTILVNNISDKCKQSQENLLNTSLFNFVTVINTKSEINIRVVEQWYIWPYPILEHADRNMSSFLHNKDWARVNYGGFLMIDNFRGRREQLKLKVRLGYKQQFGFSYSKPNIDKEQKHGITIENSYFRQHELAYKTINNQLSYYKNITTFVKTSYRSTFGYQYRQNLNTYHKLSLQYQNIMVSDSIIIKNNNYLGNNKSQTELLSFAYGFTKDKRDYIYYPLNGYFLHLSGYYKTLDFTKNNLMHFNAKFSWYKPIINKLFFGQSFAGKLSNKTKQPYYLIEGFGYTNVLRGYEYYVIDGNNNIIIKNNFRFNAIKRRNFNLNFIPWEQFNKSFFAVYINTYFDLGYVDNPYEPINSTNTMVNSWQYSAGMGIDLVTYYNTVFRIEYSVNKFGESGFFIHLGSGI